ncbi:sugar ABC transporter permease [Paenibacillus sp. JNUCC31]|uniref:carbohydrate ABC transporter permease n=1 Tax=Paenibacillus sp. JNUCC-31 TaxID=2777983 RepID=UPI0017865B3A|nr:sugar ABC transporter permease [Paenibacillus sp. JNUCC-31]QOS79421.1 sugar ABC transporter permease [Paenibacillus sp. JNUCC-31]
MEKVFGNKLAIFIFVFPGILLFVLTFLAPIALSGYYSLTNTLGPGTTINMVGLQNYIDLLFHDKQFWHSLRNALLLGGGLIIVQHPICILFAILLDQVGGKAEKLLRTIFFIPCLISVVVLSKMWVSLLDPNFGILNKLLDMIGLDFLMRAWLGDQSTALGSILFILIWSGFGWGLLFYYAGVKGIPEDLYEAAKLDGAAGFKLHSRITLPLLAPVISVQVTLAIISALKTMDMVFLTTRGGPGDSTQFLGVYLYEKAFTSNQFGYANAISILFIIICLIATYLSNKLIRSETLEG